MAIISGIFNDPFGAPLAGVLIELTARKTTTVSITGTNAAAVTAVDGSYSMPVLPGVYAVSAKIGYTPDYLGVIQVYPDSPNGTLNQFLSEFNPDDVTPEVLREMQLILIEAELAAKSAWLAAEKAKQYALIPKGVFDPDAEYQRHDLVEYDGSEYLATADVAGVVPPASPWELFVSAGAEGASAYQVWLDAGNSGSEDDFLSSLQGEPGPPGESADGSMLYQVTWSSSTVYNKDDVVSATLNGVSGLFICLADDTTASLTDPTAWRRIGGTASGIDGLSDGSDGVIQYNRSLDVTTETVTPQSSGELSWTLNISTATTVDLSTFTNGLYSTNPAAVIRLVITASEAFDVTFTGSGSYWTQDGGYSDTPPVISLDGTVPLTVAEVSLISNAAAPGVLVRQAYPVTASGSSGGVTSVNGILPDAGGNVETGDYGPDNPPPLIVPSLNEPGATGFFNFAGTTTNTLQPGDTTPGSELKYAGIQDDPASPIVVYTNNNPAGTWEVRGYIYGTPTATKVVSQLIRIDGTNLMPATLLLQATTVSERVRNCRYATEDNSVIDCEVLVREKWYPFSASPADSTTWGQAIYAAAVAGQLGEVEAYML